MKSVADRGSLHVLAAFMLSLQRCNWCQMLCSRTRCRRSVRLTGPGSPKSLNMSFRDLPVDRIEAWLWPLLPQEVLRALHTGGRVPREEALRLSEFS